MWGIFGQVGVKTLFVSPFLMNNMQAKYPDDLQVIGHSNLDAEPGIGRRLS